MINNRQGSLFFPSLDKLIKDRSPKQFTGEIPFSLDERSTGFWRIVMVDNSWRKDLQEIPQNIVVSCKKAQLSVRILGDRPIEKPLLLLFLTSKNACRHLLKIKNKTFFGLVGKSVHFRKTSSFGRYGRSLRTRE